MRKSDTHRTFDGATWPLVASRSQRIAWVREILKDDGLEIEGNYRVGVALAILADIYKCDLEPLKKRVQCLKAAACLERVEDY